MEGNRASLNYRIEDELNNLRTELYGLAPRPNEGVLAVIESETQDHPAQMQANTFLSAYVFGVFPTPDQGVQAFEQSRNVTVGRGAANLQYSWGVLQAR